MAWRLIALALVFGMPASAAANDDRFRAQSEDSRLHATIAPQGGSVRVGDFQDWELQLTFADGEPVDSARIMVGGGMPGHGHGLPTQPVVTERLGSGRYLVEGVKLSMSGRWIIAFGVVSQRGSHRLAFDINLPTARGVAADPLASLSLDAAVRPAVPSNRFADDREAAQLGERLFFDQRLSADGSLSCASCHRPEHYFTDGRKRGVGVHRVGRNTPTVVGAAHLNWFYWDGRRDSLWSQALVPFESADEMGSSRVAVVRTVGADPDYRALYERTFGRFPEELLNGELPLHAGPLGDRALREAWQRLAQEEQQMINAVYANIGKAIAAYERTLEIPPSRFDHYVAAKLADESSAEVLLTDDERKGLALFLDVDRTHCLRCHNGPLFTNGGFHNIGTGVFTGTELDFGRVYGVRSVVMDEFNCLSEYSDAAPDQCSKLRFLNRNSHVPLEGAFKVPSLRNLEMTSPYMHDGRFADLEAVIDFYRRPLEREQGQELPPLSLSDEEARQLVAFLRSLSATSENDVQRASAPTP